MEYVPAAQSMHASLPVLILYFPEAQAEHAPPFGPVDPALHLQAVSAELVLGEVEFGGHARQVAAVVAPTVVEYLATPHRAHNTVPSVLLYVPAVQGMQVSPDGPV
jgi:hypothetical protein